MILCRNKNSLRRAGRSGKSKLLPVLLQRFVHSLGNKAQRQLPQHRQISPQRHWPDPADRRECPSLNRFSIVSGETSISLTSSASSSVLAGTVHSARMPVHFKAASSTPSSSYTLIVVMTLMPLPRRYRTSSSRVLNRAPSRLRWASPSTSTTSAFRSTKSIQIQVLLLGSVLPPMDAGNPLELSDLLERFRLCSVDNAHMTTSIPSRFSCDPSCSI